jgi:uncharacterized protein YjiS (DUF1127 family)
MTTLDLFDSIPRPIPARLSLLAALRNALRAWQAEIEDRRALLRIARMDPHLIRDMGFEPAAIYDAVDGTWHDLSDARFRETYR